MRSGSSQLAAALQSCACGMQGNRDTIDGMAGGSAKVIQQVLKLVDGYDLYGRCASSGYTQPGYLVTALLLTRKQASRQAGRQADRAQPIAASFSASLARVRPAAKWHVCKALSSPVSHRSSRLPKQGVLCCSVAYPKRHTQADISDIYRLPLATRGVFTNVALQEPFGLTVIEVRPPLFCSCTIGFGAPGPEAAGGRE